MEEIIKNAIRDMQQEDILDSFDTATMEKVKMYLSKTPTLLESLDVKEDDSLFRDFSRLGDRSVDFARVKTPFKLARFSLTLFEKTWWIKKSEGVIEGPYNNNEMDLFYKEGVFELKNIKIGFNGKEFFDFKNFIKMAYPFPKSKDSHSDFTSSYNFKSLSVIPSDSYTVKSKVEDKSKCDSINQFNSSFKKLPVENDFNDTEVKKGNRDEGPTENFRKTFTTIRSRANHNQSSFKKDTNLDSNKIKSNNVGMRFENELSGKQQKKGSSNLKGKSFTELSMKLKIFNNDDQEDISEDSIEKNDVDLDDIKIAENN